MGLKPKLTFLITQDWYYISHRQSLALAAKSQGYDVSLVTQVGKYEKQIQDSGIKLIPIAFYRSVKNIFQEIITIKEIYQAYKNNQPHIIHQVSLKPCFYGALAIYLGATKNTQPLILNAFTGLGFVFTANTLYAKLIRLFIIPLFRLLFRQKNMQVVFQNTADQQTFLHHRMVTADQCHLIPGSGVEIDQYEVTPESEGKITVILVARMLIEKGVYEFVEAARKLKQANIQANFILVGDTDEENPSGIPREQLRSWQEEGVIEWWGRQNDMPSIYPKAHIVVLPSYREGFPKVVLEAAAASRAVITTDVPGCRDAILDQKTGILVPVKSVTELAAAMRELIEDSGKRIAMGKAGRDLVEERFSTQIINSQFLNIYQLYLKNLEKSGTLNA